MDDTSNPVTDSNSEEAKVDLAGLRFPPPPSTHRMLSREEHLQLRRINVLSDDEKKAIALEFCHLEGIDPYKVIRIDTSKNLAFSWKEMLYWETLLPEIERTYKLHALIHKYVG